MSFQESIRTCLQKYMDISGRARRSELWWWVLAMFAGNLLFSFVDSLLFGATAPPILGAIFGLATLLPSICVGGRRLHDRDMSAWWLLIGLIPILGTIALLVIYALEGTKGPNRFGPDPLGGTAPAAPTP